MMKNLHILCGILGNIYIAEKLKSGVMSEDRIEATIEAVNAVANHMQSQTEFRERGWAGYLLKHDNENAKLVFFDADKYELVKKADE